MFKISKNIFVKLKTVLNSKLPRNAGSWCVEALGVDSGPPVSGYFACSDCLGPFKGGRMVLFVLHLGLCVVCLWSIGFMAYKGARVDTTGRHRV